MTDEEHRATLVQVVETCRAIAPGALVFGSSVRSDGLPNDLDLLLYASPEDPAARRLLGAARKFYGWVDVFLVPPDGRMLVRNPHASGWDVARHARAIRSTAEAEGVKLDNFDAAWMRQPDVSTDEQPAAAWAP